MKISIILFVSCLLVSCQSATKRQDTEEEAVKATLVSMWDAIEKGDVERYATYVHPTFTQFGENDSLLLVGKNREVESIRQYTKVAHNVHTEMVDPLVTIHGDVAWITYYWKDQGIKDEKAFSSQGKSTRIFLKVDGKWLCIHGHYTLL